MPSCASEAGSPTYPSPSPPFLDKDKKKNGQPSRLVPQRRLDLQIMRWIGRPAARSRTAPCPWRGRLVTPCRGRSNTWLAGGWAGIGLRFVGDFPRDRLVQLVSPPPSPSPPPRSAHLGLLAIRSSWKPKAYSSLFIMVVVNGLPADPIACTYPRGMFFFCLSRDLSYHVVHLKDLLAGARPFAMCEPARARRTCLRVACPGSELEC